MLYTHYHHSSVLPHLTRVRNWIATYICTFTHTHTHTHTHTLNIGVFFVEEGSFFHQQPCKFCKLALQPTHFLTTMIAPVSLFLKSLAAWQSFCTLSMDRHMQVNSFGGRQCLTAAVANHRNELYDGHSEWNTEGRAETQAISLVPMFN